MDHLVYLESAKELNALLSGEKTMIARASMGKKRPYGKVAEGDTLFFLSGFNPKVKAMATVKSVVSAESGDLAADIRKCYGRILAPAPQGELLGMRYVVLIGLDDARPIVPFTLADKFHGHPGDWTVTENIDSCIC